MNGIMVTHLDSPKGIWGPGVYIVGKARTAHIISENPVDPTDIYFNTVVNTFSFSEAN
jgi:hypothetical protein